MKKVLASLLVLTSFACSCGMVSHALKADEKIYFYDVVDFINDNWKSKSFADCLYDGISGWNESGAGFDISKALENAKNSAEGQKCIEDFESANTIDEKVDIFNNCLSVIAPQDSEKLFTEVKKLRSIGNKTLF